MTFIGQKGRRNQRCFKVLFLYFKLFFKKCLTYILKSFIMVSWKYHRGDTTMNKEKAIMIIDQLIKNIEDNQNEESRLYVTSWVIGSLDIIKSKINGGMYYGEQNTYEELFKDFINYYFCRKIDPSVEIYAIASLFSYENIDLIVKLFEILFPLSKRNKICVAVGFIWWNNIHTNKTKLEIIRRYF